MINTPQRGFTLLIAILLATIAVTLGMSLLDISYKQVVLASTAKQSQYGFYAADSALECTLYYDQKLNAFSYQNPVAGTSILCDTRQVTDFTNTTSGTGAAARRTTTYTVPCAGAGVSASVTVYKYASGTTTMYVNGYSTCSSNDSRRVERGFKVSY